MALRKKHEVLEEPQDYEIERRETPRYNPDPEAGLSAAQVEQHREDGWRNVSVAPPAQTTKEIIRENVCTYFNLIFLVLAILLCLVGSFRDLTFLPVIIFNTLIGIVQEIRAKNVLEKERRDSGNSEVTVGKERFLAAERRKSRQGKRLTGQQINLKKLFSKQTICSPDTDGLSCINTSSIFP